MFQHDPWDYEPSYCSLVGFDLRMVHPDLLHVFHLGVGRDLAGSCLVFLVRDTDIFAGNNHEDRLKDATRQLKDFCKDHKLPLKMHRLTKAKLGWAARKYPELRTSGYDCYVVVKWLVALTTTHSASLPAALCSSLWSADHVLSLLQNGGRYLTEAEETNKETVGMIYLRSYMSLVRANLDARKRLYRLRPKFHLMDHIIRNKSKSRLNAAVYSTWMDEDFLRKMMRVMKLTDPRTAPKRLLERYILRMPGTWDKKRAGGKKLGIQLARCPQAEVVVDGGSRDLLTLQSVYTRARII